jgi:glutaredoxin-like YruB-family protein
MAKIVLFTQPGCPPCNTVKAFLSGRGIEFEERDISIDESALQDLVYKYQSRSTPTLIIDDEVMIGFDPERLNELLAG